MKKRSEFIEKGNLAIIIVILIIVSIIGYECYSVTHIELKTQTATITTVYNKIDTKALFIRQEKAVENSASGVTVPCVSDGSKVEVNGNIAMVFHSAQQAQDYSNLMSLRNEKEHYENLQSQSVGQAGSLEAINDDIDDKLIEYVSACEKGDIQNAGEDLNEIFVKRQLLIGQKVDLSSVIRNIDSQISSLNSSRPLSFVSTPDSGIFTSYTDGLEDAFDYASAEKSTVEEFKANVKKVENHKNSQSNLGKLITDFSWYIQAVVPSEKVVNLTDGQNIEIVLKNNTNQRIDAVIVSGAEPDVQQKETLLILKCNEMNTDLAKLRYENIEIRLDSYEGFKIPADALHVVDGKKGVYVLISSQVKFRETTVIYSDDEYILVKYDSSDDNGIHLYDKIITKGKDLQDGKVYT